MSTTALGASMRPQLAAARQPGKGLLDEAIAATVQRGGVDIDLIHVMDGADDKLISDEILHGTVSGAFVYSFKISGKTTTGISVVGAKHLARQYGGLKHRMVASVEKRGALHVFRSYPDGDRPMQVTTSVLPELADEDDYYTAVVEISCIKTGNSFQAEKTESRIERRSDGSPYQRPNFQTIAQSKAYRNAVLALVPQDVQAKFKLECLKQGDNKDMTDSAIDLKRNGIMTFATKNALPITREALATLDWDQISGLSEAAREGGLPAFVNSCKALGLLGGDDSGPTDAPPPTGAPKGNGKVAAEKKSEPRSATKHDPETGEVIEHEPEAPAPSTAKPAPQKAPARTPAPAGDDDGLFGAT